MTVSVSLSVSPSSPAAGAVVTASYTVTGNAAVPGKAVATTSGEIEIGGTEYEAVTTISSLATPAAAVTYTVPVCSGLTFAATSNPAVFTATVPTAGSTSGAQTVSGSVVVGSGSPIKVSAKVTLPSTTPPPPPPPASAQCYFGIWDEDSGYPADGVTFSWAGIEKFAAAPVKSATYYLAWEGPFPVGLNTLAAQNGATLYLNLEPWNTWGGGANPAMTDIAAGKYDSYLTQIGAAVKAGGVKVLITFAHEMNGTWYPWGIQAVTPAQWIAAWQHVYTVIHAAAGSLAVMVWCPNNNDVGPVTPYWPGQAYVDQAGFDGYLNTTDTSQTYASFIAPTVAEIKTLTSGSIWNAETGVAGTNREARITAFVEAMQAAGLLGFTWFNDEGYLLDASETAALCAAVSAWDA